MRTTIRTIAAMCAAILALVSCTKEPAGSKNVNPADGSRVFTLSFNATKTALNADGKTPEFCNGDVIMVFQEGGENQSLSVTVKEGTATVTVPAEIQGDFKAVYPAGAWQAEAPYIKVKNIQDGTFANANICLAEVKDGDNKMSFDNQTVLFTFDVAGYAGTYIHVISARENIANTDAYDKKEGDDGYNAHKSILNRVVVPAEAVSAIKSSESGNKICYISILPSETLKCKDLSFANGTHIKVAKENTTTLARNNFFTVKMNEGWTEPYVEVNDLKWATKNIGAATSSDKGDYFMWGYTVGHTGPSFSGQTFAEGARGDDAKCFKWDNYIEFTTATYSDGTKKVFTKYVSSAKASTYWNGEGSADNKTVLDLIDDAANMNWGGSWRMPTQEEMQALISTTGTTSTDYDKRNTYTLTIHDTSLTFPGCGTVNGTSIGDLEEAKHSYWLSSLNTDNPSKAYSLVFGANYPNVRISDDNERFLGCPVRALSD